MVRSMDSITCVCGKRHVAGYALDDDPASDFFEMWVCANCGRPAPTYFAKELAEAEEEM